MFITVGKRLDKMQLKSGIIIWSFNNASGLSVNWRKQNLNDIFSLLVFIMFLTGYQQ